MKNNINKFKYVLLKSYMTLKGVYRTLFVFKNGRKYTGGAYNALSIYTGNATFYECKTGIEPTTGVAVFDYKLKTYPYWQIGLYDWMEIMKEEKRECYEQ